jgi:hypothetical protein
MAKKSGRCALYCAIAAALLLCALAFGCKEEKAGNPSGNGGNDIKLQEEITEGAEVKDETPGETEGKYGTFPGLDAETEKRIKLDLYNYNYPEATSAGYSYFDLYFGNLSGYEIIVILGDMAVMSEVTIAGYTFINLNLMLAWKQDGSGRFYKVQEAYDLGLLTKDDIGEIYEQYLDARGRRGYKDE